MADVVKGILPIAKNEAGLATILGHEIAHYTLRHIAEKASLSQFFSILGFLAAWLFGLPLDSLSRVQQLALELPNSRVCETEGCPLLMLLISADYVGLLYMAKVRICGIELI
jgi:Zn-dependent protease with chaperone function